MFEASNYQTVHAQARITFVLHVYPSTRHCAQWDEVYVLAKTPRVAGQNSYTVSDRATTNKRLTITALLRLVCCLRLVRRSKICTGSQIGRAPSHEMRVRRSCNQMHHAKTMGFFAPFDYENLQQPHVILTFRADLFDKFRAAMIVGYYKETWACTISCKMQYFLQRLRKSTFSPQSVPEER